MYMNIHTHHRRRRKTHMHTRHNTYSMPTYDTHIYTYTPAHPMSMNTHHTRRQEDSRGRSRRDGKEEEGGRVRKKKEEE